MRRIVTAPARHCIYCGNEVGRVRRGEHIVPAAIGARRAIKGVCGRCNNRLSDLDGELCSRSPLAIIASQELDSRIWQAWDVDHSARNLLLEAEPDWSTGSMSLWPQIIFDRDGLQIRGDYEEMRRFGEEAFPKVLMKCARKCFQGYRAGERWKIIFAPLKNRSVLSQYRYPARLFATRRIGDFDDSTRFQLGYVTERDKKRALHGLEGWDRDGGFEGSRADLGSLLPLFGSFYDAGKVSRAIVKIGLNLLADTCERTEVSPAAFPQAVDLVTGARPVTARIVSSCGFVRPSSLAVLHHQGKHAFRISFDGGRWKVYSAFFSGRVCTMAIFPGPNREHWCTADITEPYQTDERGIAEPWSVQSRRIILPLSARVEHDFGQILPSLDLINVRSV